MRFIGLRGGETGPPRKALGAILAALALMLVPGTVKADSVEITFLGITANGPNWDYLYSATLTPNNYISTGDTATFFDFDGFVSGSFTPDPLLGGPNYSFTSSTDAPFQPGTLVGESVPTGDLAIGDVQFTYSGISPYLIVAGAAPGDVFLGLFRLTSTFATGAIDLVETFDTSVGADLVIGGGDDQPNAVKRLTTVARDNGFPIPTPLPVAALGGAALMGLVAARRSKGC